MLEALDDEDAWVRCHAATSLARHRTQAGWVVPRLVTMIESGDSTLRGFAARALAEFGPQATFAIPVLLKARDDPGTFVRDEVEKALKAIVVDKSAKPDK